MIIQNKYFKVLKLTEKTISTGDFTYKSTLKFNSSVNCKEYFYVLSNEIVQPIVFFN